MEKLQSIHITLFIKPKISIKWYVYKIYNRDYVLLHDKIQTIMLCDREI